MKQKQFMVAQKTHPWIGFYADSFLDAVKQYAESGEYSPEDPAVIVQQHDDHFRFIGDSKVFIVKRHVSFDIKERE